jgi:hypothetical protein
MRKKRKFLRSNLKKCPKKNFLRGNPEKRYYACAFESNFHLAGSNPCELQKTPNSQSQAPSLTFLKVRLTLRFLKYSSPSTLSNFRVAMLWYQQYRASPLKTTPHLGGKKTCLSVPSNFLKVITQPDPRLTLANAGIKAECVSTCGGIPSPGW